MLTVDAHHSIEEAHLAEVRLRNQPQPACPVANKTAWDRLNDVSRIHLGAGAKPPLALEQLASAEAGQFVAGVVRRDPVRDFVSVPEHLRPRAADIGVAGALEEIRLELNLLVVGPVVVAFQKRDVVAAAVVQANLSDLVDAQIPRRQERANQPGMALCVVDDGVACAVGGAGVGDKNLERKRRALGDRALDGLRNEASVVERLDENRDLRRLQAAGADHLAGAAGGLHVNSHITSPSRRTSADSGFTSRGTKDSDVSIRSSDVRPLA